MKFRMIWPKLAAYVVMIFIMAALSVFYRQTFMVTLFLLLLCLPALSAAAAIRAFRSLEVTLRPGRYLVSRGEGEASGEPACVSLSVTTRFLLPLFRAEILTVIRHLYYFDDLHKIFVLPVYRNQIAVDLTVPTGRCGCVAVGVKQIQVYDYLGIFSWTRDLDRREEIMIMPRARKYAKELQIHSDEGFDEYDEDVPKGNPTPNVAGIREYREGDRLGRIHWKLSARLRKLIVKEYETASHSRIYLLTELYLADRPDQAQQAHNRKAGSSHLYETAGELDRSIINGYTAGNGLLAEGISFYWGYYHTGLGDFVSIWVTTWDELDTALKDMFRAPVYSEEDLGRITYLKAGLSLGRLIQASQNGLRIS